MAQLKDTIINGGLRATESVASPIGQFDTIYAKEEVSTGITENYTSGEDKKILQSGTFDSKKTTYWASLSPIIDLTQGTSENGPKIGATIAGVSTLPNDRTEINIATNNIYGVTKLTGLYNASTPNSDLAATGIAIKAAVDTLNSNIPDSSNPNLEIASANKTLTALSIQSGKIDAATFTEIAIDSSQITSGIGRNTILYGDSTGVIQSTAPAWGDWNNGTTAGPQAKIQIGAITYTSPAIPAASTDVSGIVTTGDQSFSGRKTFTGICLSLTPAAGEGGEIHLNASTANTTQAGIVLDQFESKFRIFGIASADGETIKGVGTPLVIDPYNKTITGGYTLTGSLNGNASTSTRGMSLHETRINDTNIHTWVETNANVHHGSNEELNLIRIYSNSYASYNLPVVDTHNLVFSIDNLTNWFRILSLDIRSNDIYTKQKDGNNNTWSAWVKLLNSDNWRREIFTNKNKTLSTLSITDSPWAVIPSGATDVFGLSFKDTALSTDTGDWRMWLEKSGTATTLNMRIDGNIQATTFVGALSGNASTATKATQDGSGNVITSKYVTLDTDQTITGTKSWGTSGAGGQLNGAATNGGINSIRVGDDVWLGDCNSSGIMGMKSTSTNCGFYFYNNSGTQIGQLYCRGANGDIYSNKPLIAPSTKSSWLDGQRYEHGGFNLTDATDDGSYWPWMRQTNTSTGKWFSMGTLGSSFYIIGSATSRTANGYDHGWRFDLSNGYLYGNFSGSLSGHASLDLPLTGGTLTDSLTIQKNGLWIQGGSAAGSNNSRMGLTSGVPDAFPYNQSKRGVKIYSNAIALADPYNGNSNNDAGWLRHIEETANSGVLELGVGDDGNESIVARQYNTSSAIVRTLTLLDANGNSSFPGTISCIPNTSNMAASNMAFNGGIQVRENGAVGNSQSAIEYGPRISFHWANRLAKSITLHSNGTFYFRDQNGTTRSTIDANVVGNVTGNCSGSSGSCTGNAATATSTTRLARIADNTAGTDTNGFSTNGLNVRFYSETGKISGQPTQWGFLFTVATGEGGNETHQLWAEQANGSLYHRGTNGSSHASPPGFKTILDTGNMHAHVTGHINIDKTTVGDLYKQLRDIPIDTTYTYEATGAAMKILSGGKLTSVRFGIIHRNTDSFAMLSFLHTYYSSFRVLYFTISTSGVSSGHYYIYNADSTETYTYP